MGMQVSKLIPGEITKTTKQISKVEIQGSNFQDRMFIKLASNRRILREAAKKETWPLNEDDQKPQLKQRKNGVKKDDGMNLFWSLLESVDKSLIIVLQDKNEALPTGWMKKRQFWSTLSEGVELMTETQNRVELLSPELVKFSSLKNLPILSNHRNFRQNW